MQRQEPIRETGSKFSAIEKRRIFAAEYVIDLNEKRAAIAAGYSEDRGNALLGDSRVKALITFLLHNRAKRLEIKSDKVLEELARLAFSNMLDYMEIDEHGQPRGIDLTKLNRDSAAAIQEISEDATGGQGDGERRLVIRRRFKLADKLRALELVMKHMGMLRDRVDVNVQISIADSVRSARERLKIVECLPKQTA